MNRSQEAAGVMFYKGLFNRQAVQHGDLGPNSDSLELRGVSRWLPGDSDLALMSRVLLW